MENGFSWIVILPLPSQFIPKPLATQGQTPDRNGGISKTDLLFSLQKISYGLELESLKSVVTLDSFKEPTQREEAKKAIKKLFEER